MAHHPIQHIPVLLEPVLNALMPEGKPVARVIDGTVGAGGHAHALLDAGVETILGLDLDKTALVLAQETLRAFTDRVHLAHNSYEQMRDEAQKLGWQSVDGILLDFGVSSMQLDRAERGFAFRHDGPLDMRFNPDRRMPTAADIVNLYDAAELAKIFYKYGEERHSRLFAKAIIEARPLETTQQLAQIIEQAAPRQKGKRHTSSIHPATRIFQALRIVVNDELGAVERALPHAIDLLHPGGRLAVISFHSLEDRIVKQTFKDASMEFIPPPGMASMETKRAIVKLITRKPVEATEAEVVMNPRSRSAKLRVVEKL